VRPAGLGQQLGQRGDQRPVGPRPVRALALTPQDRQLVPQQQDYRRFGRVICGQDREPGNLLPEDQVDERQRHTRSTTINLCRLTGHEAAAQPHRRPFSAPTGTPC